MKDKVMKKLLTIDKNAGRALHEVFFIDFNKPFNAYEIAGKFTINQILKAIEKDGYNVYNSTIIALTTNVKYRENRIFAATISGLNAIDIDYKFYKSDIPSKLDNYGTKGSFNDYRKESGITTFVVCQEEKNLAHMSGHNPDLTQRFDYIASSITYKNTECRDFYISEVHLVRRDDNGSSYFLGGWRNRYYFGNGSRCYKEVSEIIDKSGYLLTDKRENLKRKAEALRKDRAKKAYQETNNAERIQELKKAVFDKKDYFAKALQAATTAEEVAAITDKLWKFNGLQGLFKDFEFIAEKDSEKAFSSVAKFNEYCDKLEKGLAAL